MGVRTRFRTLLSTAGLDTVFSPHVLRSMDAAYEGHSFPQDLFEAQRRESPSSTRSPTTPLGLLDRFRASGERDVAGQPEGAVDPEYFDHEVLTLCRREFGLPGRLSRRSYHTVWLSVLSYLETTAHSRAFRMQALFEFSKNMLIVSELLSVYYLVLLATGGLNRALGVVLDVFPVPVPVRTLPVLVGLVFVSVAFMDVFARLSTRFLSQWHLYSKMEFYVDRTLNG
ncbi:hypothetical protein [Salinigranum salinum]|uniref:hypothetical protein n=1 Tax=Salinigranum salinum TaxID=1364937 RepID=UPI0012606094|nr:hypothetical protein [Salinigranum salinum]